MSTLDSKKWPGAAAKKVKSYVLSSIEMWNKGSKEGGTIKKDG